LPLCIDPLLLFKSRDPELRTLHTSIVEHFADGVSAIAKDDELGAKYILDFPEVAEIGFGYGASDKRGSGLGKILTTLLIGSLKVSPAIMERGIRHVEEMQLISPGIGPDRVGDIASNILKEYLIRYTLRQCEVHKGRRNRRCFFLSRVGTGVLTLAKDIGTEIAAKAIIEMTKGS
jgi:hypothetical protein